MNNLLDYAVILAINMAGCIAIQWLYNKWRTRKRANLKMIHAAHYALIDGLEHVDDMNACMVVWTERENPQCFHIGSNVNPEQFVDALANMRMSGMLRMKWRNNSNGSMHFTQDRV